MSVLAHPRPAPLLSRHTFVAMGSAMELIVAATGPEVDAALAGAESEIRRLERIFSRFRPESELSRLNARGRIEGSADLAEVTALALVARERTGGRFDPTVHDAVVRAGYDRSFDELALSGASVEAGSACGGEVAVDGTTIEIESGYRLDLGGIAKGHAADRACTLLSQAGPCLVNAGGDIAVCGTPAWGVWPIEVELPDGSLTLGLTTGGMATSGRDVRRWHRGDAELHHLIDPATGLPSKTPLVRVTACGPSAADAEVTAKALLLAGDARAASEANALGIPAVLVGDDGGVVLTGGLG